MTHLITSKQQIISSREIATLTGKLHRHVMRDIREMEPAWEKINGSNFGLVKYQDAKGEFRPEYQLTKSECLYIATKFNDEARAILIKRWEELERAGVSRFEIPKTLSQALHLAATQAEQIEAQQQKIEADKPKVLFADAVASSKTSILVGDLSKILQQNGVDIGQNRLFRWMRENGYLISRRGSHNIPTQKAMQRGLFEIKETSITHASGAITVKTTPKITGKGQVYFVERLMSAETQENKQREFSPMY